MFLKRQPYNCLELWKKTKDFKPLLIRGARQVGKTRLVEEFGRNEFGNLVVVNFEKERRLRPLFTGDLDVKKILSRLEVEKGVPIKLGETLLFFDEIQQCPEAITALRYFYEELPKLHVIAAGSLLEFALEKISVPVGRVSLMTVYPLSFSEFLEARGRADLKTYLPYRTANDHLSTAAPKIYDFLREYLVVGGMPEAVVAFRSGQSFKAVQKIHWDLINAFVEDMGKYARGERQLENVETVFRRIFRFLTSEITYSTLSDGENTQRTAKSLMLLEKAKIIHRVLSTSPVNLPLGGHTHLKHFKCLFLDVGLGQTLAGMGPGEVLDATDLTRAHEGRVAEQFVGQQLLSETEAASEAGLLYCWMRQSRSAKAEVDYLLSRNRQILPLEVKAGKYGRLRSLQVLFKEYPKIKHGICLSHVNDITREGNLTRAPLFTVVGEDF